MVCDEVEDRAAVFYWFVCPFDPSLGRTPRTAARTHGTRAQAPRAHGSLRAAGAAANPLTVADVPFGRQPAEYFSAPQRRRARPRSPDALALAASAIAHPAALHRIQPGNQVTAATACPRPHAGAAELHRDEVAECAAGNVAAWRERPDRQSKGRGTSFHAAYLWVRE